MEKHDSYEELRIAIYKRFKHINFTVSCFKTTDEIETKILNDTDETIIISDVYENNYFNSKGKLITREPMRDFFILKRRPEANAIYYKDVIDLLKANNFVRNDSGHQYLEGIGISKLNVKRRNKNSIKVYGFSWGS